MEPLIVVEVLDKSGKVHERHRVRAFPATLGRGYDCDVILGDEFVSPQHARIAPDAQGELVLTDLGSANGTQDWPGLQAVASRVLGPETVLRLGHTLVRLRKPEFALAPTRIDTLASQRFARLLNSPLTLILLTLVLLAVLALDTYQSLAEDTKLGLLLLEVLGFASIAPVWAVLWALLSRLFVHHASYLAHAVIATLAVIGFMLVNLLVEYLAFGYSARVSADILFHGLLGLLAWAALYGHLRFTTLFTPRRNALIGAGVASVVIGFLGLVAYVQNLEFSDSLPYPPELKPPQFQLSASRSTEQFTRDAEALTQELEHAN